MIIRKANDLDCYDVFQWRNDIISKQMFFNNKNLNYDEHLEWFQNILKDSHKTIYIGEDRGKKIGVCRFDYKKDNYSSEVSININPSFRNKGLGKILLNKAIKYYESENLCTLVANIKKINHISKKIFLNAGFVFTKEDELNITLERTAPIIIFKKIDVNDVDQLFKLLKKRKYYISHHKMPSYLEHKDFVLSNPYKHWFIIEMKNNILGTFYIQTNNSIGINIINPNIVILREVLDFINSNFKPEKVMPSKVPPYFFINVAQSNVKLKKILLKTGCIPIQTSYMIKSDGFSDV